MSLVGVFSSSSQHLRIILSSKTRLYHSDSMERTESNHSGPMNRTELNNSIISHAIMQFGEEGPNAFLQLVDNTNK